MRGMAANLFEQIRAVLVEQFEIAPDSVSREANLYEDLGIDSIDAVDLIVRLREITGKQVPPDRFKSVRTIGDVIGVLETL
jgi:acyl carrier protein